MRTLILWSQQPTSVAGLAAILGTLSGLLTRQISFMQALPIFVGALASIAIPDNTRAKAGAEAITAAVASIVLGEKR